MIINKTKKCDLAKDFFLCKNIFSKARGLMFSKKKNLIFIFDKEQKISLHMLFVFFPIWAIYLDDSKKVITVKKLYPFISFCDPKVKARYVIEVVKEPNLSMGDTLSW